PEAVRAGVPAHLGSLVRKRFLRPEPRSPEEERFRFDHVLIREAAYGGLLKRARATLHERFVDWADRVNRERGRETEYEEILGYHLEQAHRYLSELGPLDDLGRAPRVRARRHARRREPVPARGGAAAGGRARAIGAATRARGRAHLHGRVRRRERGDRRGPRPGRGRGRRRRRRASAPVPA